MSALGLAPTVADALGNSTVPTCGLYGAPRWVAPPTTPQSSGIWGTLYNAATDFATNPLGTLEAAVGLIYTGAVATVHFFDNLPREIAVAGGQLLKRTLGALEAVGDVILRALQLLEAALFALAQALLSALVGPIGSAFHAAIRGWQASWNGTATYVDGYYLSTTQSGQSANATPARSGIWSGLGPVLLAMLCLTAVLAVVNYLLAPFSIGTGIVTGLILTAISAAFVFGPLAGHIGFGSVLSDYDGNGLGYFASVSQTLFNATMTPLTSSEAMAIAVPDGDPFEPWGALAATVGGMAAIVAGYYLLAEAGTTKAPGSGLAAALFASFLAIGAMAIMAISIDASNDLPTGNTSDDRLGYQADSGSAALALGFACAGFILGVIAQKSGGASAMNTVCTLICLIVGALAAATIVWNYHTEGVYP